MEIIKIENLSFKYPASFKESIDNLSLTVEKGEFLTIIGKSGCGKTTLLRLLKPLISPNGEKQGNIYYMGEDVLKLSDREQASKIGFVMQNPDSQIVTDKVWHELAFGLEGLGLENEEIRRRVGETASYFGIQNWFHKNTSELSGGQKQLLNLASVMAMSPDVLILDEPTGQLDPLSSEEFINAVYKINKELGTTIILSEHRTEDIFDKSDRIAVMENGKIIACDKPKQIANILKEKKSDIIKALPACVKIYSSVEDKGDSPINTSEGRRWLNDFVKTTKIDKDCIKKTRELKKDAVIEIKDLWTRYEKDGENIIKSLNLTVYNNELLSVVGGNGTGKTTLFSVIGGILPKLSGSIKIKDNLKIITLPQNPEMLFLKSTVKLDLESVAKDEKRLDEVVKLCEIKALLDRHPYDLSGGEKQRAALAKVLLCSGDILLLDEPTKALDASFKEKLADILLLLKKQGMTIVLVTHDIEFAAEYSDRVALFFDGGIVGSGTPESFFSSNAFYTTPTSKMAREILPQAVVANDVIKAIGGKSYKNEYNKAISDYNKDDTSPVIKEKEEKADKRLSKRTWTMLIILLTLVPLTIYTGINFFGDRKYYFISVLIMLETFIPFLMIYEGRKPKAREIAIIAVLCALAVAGRTIFYMAQQFKPVVAIVIISGICFGGETGFLVGTVTAFCSNIFSGQGPWTPWQMFALGTIGFTSGVLFKKGLLKKNKLTLCIFGGLATFIIYGGIMNPASVIMWNNNPTWEMILSAYLLGVPYDSVHALATIVFLWFISEPMTEKLERIKLKHNILR